MKNRRSIFPVVFCLCFVTLLSCGKKGPPFLPGNHMALKVERLTGEWTKDGVLLKGSLRTLEGKGKEVPEVTGYRVYHARYDLKNPPCEGCPIDYSGFEEVQGGIFEGDGFLCELYLRKKEGVHFFEVRLIGRKGAVGPPSNRVKLNIEN